MEIEIRSKVHGIKKVIIDDEDANKVIGLRWYLRRCPQHNDRFYASSCKQKNLHMHRLIMDVPAGDKNLFVDHKNGDGLDNRRSNLRICTLSQNMMNRVKLSLKKTTSIYKGVGFHKGRFRAYIHANGGHKSLGYYDDQRDAAKAYNEAAIKYFGEFARLNEV